MGDRFQESPDKCVLMLLAIQTRCLLVYVHEILAIHVN